MICLRPQGTARNNRIRPSTFAVPSNREVMLAGPFGLSPRTNEIGQSMRSKPLIMAVLVISVAIAILSQLGHHGLASLQTRQIEGFSAFGLNALIAILGFWTPERAAWVAYLGASVLAFLLLSV